MNAPLLFAAFAPKNLEPANSIGNKFDRLLERFDLASTVGGRRVCIKMHLGGGGGFSTIHPFSCANWSGRSRRRAPRRFS